MIYFVFSKTILFGLEPLVTHFVDNVVFRRIFLCKKVDYTSDRQNKSDCGSNDDNKNERILFVSGHETFSLDRKICISIDSGKSSLDQHEQNGG